MMKARLSSFRFAGLFLVSMALVAYELAVMRVFSVGSWSNFGSMVISIALLGYGIAGTILTLLEKRIAGNPDPWLAWSAALLGPAMAAAYCVAQLVPFNPVMITNDPNQLLWIASYYAIYAVPFIIGSIFVGASFVAFRSRIHALYFWNMLGSGLGGFLVLGLLTLVPTDHLVAPLVALAALGALLAAVGRDERGLVLPPRRIAFATGGFVIALAALVPFGAIRASEWKPMSYARDFPDARRVYHSFGPTGEYDAWQSSFFHLAPGLSDNASSGVAKMPTDAFLGLYIDGDGPIGVMRRLDKSEEAYFDYLPMAAPYILLDSPRVLLLRMGGGIGAYDALYHGAKEVTIVEPDPALVHMMRDVPFFKRYTGGLLADPRIRLESTEPRAFAASSTQTFDLAEIGLVDSVGLSTTGGYPVVENYLYTAEGIASYLGRLSPGGILSITVWNRLTPPRNVPKLLSTVIAAMKIRGVADPGADLFVFDQLLSTATILVKNGAFSPGEIAALRGFTARMSFIPCWYPGMAPPATDMAGVLAAYRAQLDPSAANPAASSPGGSAASAAPSDTDFLQEDLYYWTIASLTGSRGNEIIDNYVFAIDPATDDRPYYTGYVKPSTIGLVAADIRDLSEEWGYLLLVATLVLSVGAGILIILIPIFGRWRELFSRKKGTARVILYFAALGIGYMLVEIFLIQRLTFFLVDPIFSNSIVITSMLVISGLGSLAAGSSRAPRRRVVALAVGGIALSCLFYAYALPSLVDGLLGLALPLKIGIAVLMIAPAAFCLGIPFPTGLDALSRSRPGLVPWAWGVNGALSVTGTVLARLVSVSSGFSVVLALTAGLYLFALLVFSGNEAAVGAKVKGAGALNAGSKKAGAAAKGVGAG
ncbi:MAG TPA: hypothetical protein VMV83_15215 [Rectinemataceae bacterium]|nr:hypothetical protein [Rectinemataceae bacterium]